MPQGFQGRQIIGISLQNVTKCLARFFIISKSAIRLCATPGGLDGIRIEDQRGVKRMISDLKTRMRECGASARDGNSGGDRAMIEGAQKMIGSIGVIYVEGSSGGGSQGRIALILRKALRQGVPLSEKNCCTVFVFETMNQQRARSVIFEQREIVGIDLRARRKIP